MNMFLSEWERNWEDRERLVRKENWFQRKWRNLCWKTNKYPVLLCAPPFNYSTHPPLVFSAGTVFNENGLLRAPPRVLCEPPIVFLWKLTVFFQVWAWSCILLMHPWSTLLLFLFYLFFLVFLYIIHAFLFIYLFIYLFYLIIMI
jgi:hypothetical protein